MRRNWKFERRCETFFTSTHPVSLNKTKSPPSSLAFAARPFERRWRSERRVPESKAKRSFTDTEREKGFKKLFISFFLLSPSSIEVVVSTCLLFVSSFPFNVIHRPLSTPPVALPHGSVNFPRRIWTFQIYAVSLKTNQQKKILAKYWILSSHPRILAPNDVVCIIYLVFFCLHRTFILFFAVLTWFKKKKPSGESFFSLQFRSTHLTLNPDIIRCDFDSKYFVRPLFLLAEKRHVMKKKDKEYTTIFVDAQPNNKNRNVFVVGPCSVFLLFKSNIHNYRIFLGALKPIESLIRRVNQTNENQHLSDRLRKK